MVHEVKGRVVGRRNLSVGWQEVEVAVLGRLLAVPDDGEEESRFIVCGPLERRSDRFLRLGDRRVDHKSGRLERRSASSAIGVGHRLVQLGGHVRQEREFREALALGADDQKVAPAHAGSISVTPSIGQDPGRSARHGHSAGGPSPARIAAGIRRAPDFQQVVPRHADHPVSARHRHSPAPHVMMARRRIRSHCLRSPG